MSKLEDAPQLQTKTAPAAKLDGLLDRVIATRDKAIRALQAMQTPEGYWVEELEGDTILESEYILMQRVLGFPMDARVAKAARYLRDQQREDGSWSLYPGGPGEISSSVKAYFALKLTGSAPAEAHMLRAKGAIIRMGGVRKVNTYTRFYLAMLGQISRWAPPAVPPELVLLPDSFYLNIYELSSWSRAIVVSLAIIWAHHPVTRVPESEGISELLDPRAWRPFQGWDPRIISWKNFFLGADRLLKLAEALHLTPWRKKALAAAEKWMLDHFEGSGGLGAIFPPMVNALLALRCLGYADDHPQVVRARRELEALAIEDDESLRMQPCVSPVWDTAIAVIALNEAGLPPDAPVLQRAAKWLVSKEVRQPGDWCVKCPDVEPSGWVFEFANDFYPDIDDTAMVLMALTRAAQQPGGSEAIQRGIAWIMAMQGSDGGWASFDRDNNRMIFTQIPFADHNAMLDPSTADITGRILEMLGGFGYTPGHPHVARAIEFLREEQEEDGSWYGRWGVNYIYGTWQVLKGLRIIGEEMDQEYIHRAANWLRGCQNPDGGWGESCRSYDDPSHKGVGPSTPSQTAWALMGLFAAGDLDSDAVRNGLDYLAQTQQGDGNWDEPYFTGTGFPKVFYLKYHLYRLSFPIFALGSYVKLRLGEEGR